MINSQTAAGSNIELVNYPFSRVRDYSLPWLHRMTRILISAYGQWVIF